MIDSLWIIGYELRLKPFPLILSFPILTPGFDCAISVSQMWANSSILELSYKNHKMILTLTSCSRLDTFVSRFVNFVFRSFKVNWPFTTSLWKMSKNNEIISLKDFRMTHGWQTTVHLWWIKFPRGRPLVATIRVATKTT